MQKPIEPVVEYQKHLEPEWTFNYHNEHFCVMYKDINKHEWHFKCACSASWTQPLKKTFSELEDIYSSHLKYFNRPKMETL